MKGYKIVTAVAVLIGIFALGVVAKENGTITGDNLRVRKAPSVKARIIGELNKGERVEALFKTDFSETIGGTNAPWYNIYCFETNGYVFGGYLELDKGVSVPIESEVMPDESERLCIIGLLEVHQLNEMLALTESAHKPGPLKFYSEPDSKSKVIAEISDPKYLIIREHDYYFQSLETYKETEGWYLASFILDGVKKTGWISPADVVEFRSLQKLLTNSLTYLTDDWDGRISKEPKDSGTYEYFTSPDTDVRMVDSKQVGPELWLKIEILSPSPCEAAETKVVKVGWIKAYSKTGNVNVWFYSRGC
ncbi:MAG: SH3 domain-containing protein [Deltaproteobacteria bacterium]|uniref:SH3 domain-containing protein n=1 Tax=Candidatus Zymogenus saltonus TaxID=2844893 RepID=A0A9D8KID2_9DELT|nr:SH3 domain-containing protein [Candidatus Zymogenus saltonus]